MYDTVLHHIEKWYNDHPDEARKAKCTEIEKGIYVLSLKQKQQILLDNIFGVDIDRQAVEVAQLSLFLKLLESESGATAEQLSFERTKILPDLSKNIQCGNSLVEYDISDLFPLTDEEEKRIKPFSFQSAFREIMSNGGFDAIVGNPPYVLLQDEFRDDHLLEYYKAHYSVASYKIDLYHLFIERTILLVKKNGLVSLITPSNYLTNNYLNALRKFLLDTTSLREVNSINGNVFGKVSVTSAIFVAQKEEPDNNSETKLSTWQWLGDKAEIEKQTISKQKTFSLSEYLLIKSTGDEILLKKIAETAKPLSQIAKVNFGMQLRDRKKFPDDVVEIKVPDDRKRLTIKHVPCITGKDVQRYILNYSNLYCCEDFEARRGGCWDLNVHHQKDKIIVRQIGIYPICCLDETGYDCLNTVFMITPVKDFDMRALLGLINSQLLRFYWIKRFGEDRQTFPKIKGTYLLDLPINFGDATQSTKLSKFVDQMLATKKQAAVARSDSEREQFQRKCDYLDGEIDKLVYTLYGLTAEEIKIVEGK